MAFYSQWRAKVDAGEQPKRITWVCGPERVLVEEVVDHVRGALAASDLDYVSLVVGVDAERDIWAAVNQYPSGPEARRLVVIRSAEELRRWQQVGSWLADARKLPGSYLIFVSGEPDFYHKDADGKNFLPDHLETMKGRSSLVRCTPLSPDDLWAWCRRRTPQISRVDALWLATRCAGSMVHVRNVLDQVAVLSVPLDRGLMDPFISQFAGAGFLDALLALHRREALAALALVPPGELGRVLAQLATRLDTLAVLNQALRAGKTLGDVSRDGAVSQYMARKLFPHAKHYDRGRVAHCRQTLAVADDAFRRGVRDAVGEALVATW